MTIKHAVYEATGDQSFAQAEQHALWAIDKQIAREADVISIGEMQYEVKGGYHHFHREIETGVVV